MIKIGLTGGIGSGKTYVSSFFEDMGIPIYNSDDRAKILINTNVSVKENLIQEFGNQVFNIGELNRNFLSKIVFSDEKKLKKLNSIVHPVVKKDFEKWCYEHKKHKYVIQESAILIENEAYKKLDYIVLVIAPKNIRIQRVIKRNSITKKQVEERINKQLPDTEKLKYANFVIHNSGKEDIQRKVNEINKILNSNEF